MDPEMRKNPEDMSPSEKVQWKVHVFENSMESFESSKRAINRADSASKEIKQTLNSSR